MSIQILWGEFGNSAKMGLFFVQLPPVVIRISRSTISWKYASGMLVNTN